MKAATLLTYAIKRAEIVDTGESQSLDNPDIAHCAKTTVYPLCFYRPKVCLQFEFASAQRNSGRCRPGLHAWTHWMKGLKKAEIAESSNCPVQCALPTLNALLKLHAAEMAA
jgi:hypothetical protein